MKFYWSRYRRQVFPMPFSRWCYAIFVPVLVIFVTINQLFYLTGLYNSYITVGYVRPGLKWQMPRRTPFSENYNLRFLDNELSPCSLLARTDPPWCEIIGPDVPVFNETALLKIRDVIFERLFRWFASNTDNSVHILAPRHNCIVW